MPRTDLPSRLAPDTSILGLVILVARSRSRSQSSNHPLEMITLVVAYSAVPSLEPGSGYFRTQIFE